MRSRAAVGTSNRFPTRSVGRVPARAASYEAARPRPMNAPPMGTVTVATARTSATLGRVRSFVVLVVMPPSLAEGPRVR